MGDINKETEESISVTDVTQEWCVKWTVWKTGFDDCNGNQKACVVDKEYFFYKEHNIEMIFKC